MPISALSSSKLSQIIKFVDNFKEIKNFTFDGFFVGWRNKPKNLKLILQNSTYFVVVLNNEKIVGFITCIRDKVLSAYIPLLEVLPEFQKQGIGKQLVQKILEKVTDLYVIGLICDENLNNFYQKLDFKNYNGCIIRNPGGN